MSRRIAIALSALFLLMVACDRPLHAQKTTPIAPAEPLKAGWEAIDERLLFLMTRLASVEASLDAIEKALKTTSGKQLIKVADAKRAELENRSMDRKGGGPMKWSDFYGTTAEKFFYHPVDRNTTYHTVTILGSGGGQPNPQPPHNRPPQFDYIYRANENAKAGAENDIAKLGKKLADLVDRRRSLEEEQSALWCEIAFRAVSRLDLSRKPLYRFELSSPSLSSSDIAGIVTAVNPGCRLYGARALDA
jgi:hypothetical protein